MFSTATLTIIKIVMYLSIPTLPTISAYHDYDFYYSERQFYRDSHLINWCNDQFCLLSYIVKPFERDFMDLDTFSSCENGFGVLPRENEYHTSVEVATLRKFLSSGLSEDVLTKIFAEKNDTVILWRPLEERAGCALELKRFEVEVMNNCGIREAEALSMLQDCLINTTTPSSFNGSVNLITVNNSTAKECFKNLKYSQTDICVLLPIVERARVEESCLYDGVGGGDEATPLVGDIMVIHFKPYFSLLECTLGAERIGPGLKSPASYVVLVFSILLIIAYVAYHFWKKYKSK